VSKKKWVVDLIAGERDELTGHIGKGRSQADDGRHQRVPVPAQHSAKSDQIGARLFENMIRNTLFIGTVLAPGVIYHRNAIKKNVTEFKTHLHGYYWQLPPYHGPQ